MAWLAAELPPDMPPACIAKAAERHNVPEIALVSILKQERGKVGEVSVKDGRNYYGPFQISEIWLPRLIKWGITESKLLYDACSNAIAGAFVLSLYRSQENNWFDALARFNVGSLGTLGRRNAGYRYATKVSVHWGDIETRHGVVTDAVPIPAH